jgi:hypothetical protein
MEEPLRVVSDKDQKLSPAALAAFKRARKNVARALAHPQVKAALRAQREAIERDREERSRKRA